MSDSDAERLLGAVKSGDTKAASEIGEKLKDGLSDEKKKMLERALGDGEYLKSILSSERAKKIIESLEKKGKI